MQPTGMSSQRCSTALKNLRFKLSSKHFSGPVDPAANDDTGQHSDELREIQDDLRLDIGLRNARTPGGRMSAVERDVYYPAIVGILTLLESAERFIDAEGRPLIVQARALADLAIAKVLARTQSDWRLHR